MVSNSKILTVSYGTFSCTLEGFDEPFNTMKSIAEYFRDLAADDRYFGAEPPTPDAEMLHRIAEREIQKRVEARIEDDGVILRQADAETSQQTAVGATLVAADHLLAGQTAATDDTEAEGQDDLPVSKPVSEDAPAPKIQNEAPTPEAVSAESDTPTPVVTTAASTPDDAPALGSIADKLQRIRAVVDEKRAEGETAFVATDQYAEDQDAARLFEDGEEYVQTDLNDTPAQPPETDAAASGEEDADEAPLSPEEIRELRQRRRARRAEKERQQELEDEASQPADISDADEESPSDAPVAEAEEAPALADDQSTPSTVSTVLAAMDDEDGQNIGQEDAFDSEEDAEESSALLDRAALLGATPRDAEIDDAEDLSRNDGEDTISGVLSRLNADVTQADDAADNAADTAELADDTAEDDEARADAPDMGNDLSALVSGTIGSDDAETGAADTAEADDLAELPDDAAADITAEDTSEDTADESEATTEDTAEAEATSPLRKPRVIRVRHIKGGRAETLTQDAEEPASQDNENSMLTPAEEAELMAELAEAEAEARGELERDDQVADLVDDAVVEGAKDTQPEERTTEVDDADVGEVETQQLTDDADQDVPAEEDGPKLTAFDDGGVGKSDDALDRILAETNSHMESTEVSRRRSAIAHLKAAVQATRADKDTDETLGGDAGADSVGAYRDDLARVVRPRRPGKPDTPARRMPPLVLVSEQRIDETRAEEAPASPATTEIVRPRRVMRDPQVTQGVDEAEEDVSSSPSNDAGFIDYVEQTGAHQLGELLEAAACHTVLVNGQETFTRPMVMGMVRRYVGEDSFSREEGLRAFGKLLREGRIKRLKRGQFELTETTRFRPNGAANGKPDDRQSA